MFAGQRRRGSMTLVIPRRNTRSSHLRGCNHCCMRLFHKVRGHRQNLGGGSAKRGGATKVGTTWLTESRDATACILEHDKSGHALSLDRAAAHEPTTTPLSPRARITPPGRTPPPGNCPAILWPVRKTKPMTRITATRYSRPSRRAWIVRVFPRGRDVFACSNRPAHPRAALWQLHRRAM